jgi:hypothetical protein
MLYAMERVLNYLGAPVSDGDLVADAASLVFTRANLAPLSENGSYSDANLADNERKTVSVRGLPEVYQFQRYGTQTLEFLAFSCDHRGLASTPQLLSKRYADNTQALRFNLFQGVSQTMGLMRAYQTVAHFELKMGRFLLHTMAHKPAAAAYPSVSLHMQSHLASLSAFSRVQKFIELGLDNAIQWGAFSSTYPLTEMVLKPGVNALGDATANTPANVWKEGRTECFLHPLEVLALHKNAIPVETRLPLVGQQIVADQVVQAARGIKELSVWSGSSRPAGMNHAYDVYGGGDTFVQTLQYLNGPEPSIVAGRVETKIRPFRRDLGAVSDSEKSSQEQWTRMGPPNGIVPPIYFSSKDLTVVRFNELAASAPASEVLIDYQLPHAEARKYLSKVGGHPFNALQANATTSSTPMLINYVGKFSYELGLKPYSTVSAGQLLVDNSYEGSATYKIPSVIEIHPPKRRRK